MTGMDVVVLAGRILFVALFLANGYAHLAHTETMAGYAASRGVPAARLVTLASGVLLVAGALLVLLGVWADLGALLLFLFVIPTAVLMHAFWRESDPQTRQLELVQFQKDVALGGAALLIFGLLVELGDGLGLTITGPLLR
jgi:putative oxidoreductase